MIIDPTGPRCACGNRGCFETVAAGPAIVRKTLAGWAARRNGNAPPPTGSAPARGRGGLRRGGGGDEVARDVVESAGRAVAWGIHLLALAYDVERIVLGGGVSHAGEPFMAPILQELDRYRTASPLAAEILRPDLVQLLPPGADAGAWGAVAIARESLGLGSESARVRL